MNTNRYIIEYTEIYSFNHIATANLLSARYQILYIRKKELQNLGREWITPIHIQPAIGGR